MKYLTNNGCYCIVQERGDAGAVAGGESKLGERIIPPIIMPPTIRRGEQTRVAVSTSGTELAYNTDEEESILDKWWALTDDERDMLSKNIDIESELAYMGSAMDTLERLKVFLDTGVRNFQCPITPVITSQRMRYNHTYTCRCSIMRMMR